MEKVVRCCVLIIDDFNNVLVAERGKGKNDSPKQWGVFGRALKGKEDGEACIAKVVDKQLGCTIFDLEKYKEYALNPESEGTLKLFTGKIREMVTLHKEINRVKWIRKTDLASMEFAEYDKNILEDYFDSNK